MSILMNKAALADFFEQNLNHFQTQEELAMNKAAVEQLMNTLNEIIGLSVESRIKLEALERVQENSNPLLHAEYLGEIENLKEQRTFQLNPATIADLKSKLLES
jgi:hypothetical protein